MNLLRGLITGALVAGGALACGAGDTEPSPVDTGNSRFPLLTNHGGRVLSPMRLVVIAAANDNLRDSLFAFGRALVASQWWKDVATPFDISPVATAVSVVGPTIAGGTMSIGDINVYVQKAAIDSAGFRPDGHTVYLVYLPEGVGCAECDRYPGFHNRFGMSDAFAVVRRNQPGYSSTMSAMTFIGSHEVIEAASDPQFDAWRLDSSNPVWNATAWALDDNGNFSEAADLCSGTRYREGGYDYERIFSNQAAMLGGDPCVPTLPSPYYNVTTDKSWYATTTREVDVPVTGWSVGTLPNWPLLVRVGLHTPFLDEPILSLSCADSVAIGGDRLCAMNNGKRVNLHVSLPAEARSKAFFAIQIFSFRSNAAGSPLPGEDFAHHWSIGVYVP